MLTTILKSIDTFGILGITSSSIMLSLTGICSRVIPIMTGIECGLTISIKVTLEIVMRKYSEYKKQYQKHRKTIKPFDNLYRKDIQGNLIDKIEYEFLCSNFIKYVDETSNNFF